MNANAPDLSAMANIGPSVEAELPAALRPYVSEYYEAG